MPESAPPDAKNATSGAKDGSRRDKRPHRLSAWLFLSGLLVLWIGFFIQASVFWDPNSYYNYGWAVPALALFLVWRRLRDLPEPNPQKGAAVVVLVSATLAAFTQFLAESIPNWRFLIWFHAGLMIALSLAVAWRLGGPRWAVHLLFPLLFVLTALPWPMRFEIPIISHLTDGVVQFAVTTLRIFGLPAVYQGNVIDVAGQSIMVGDVCSGIRSLQALVMAGLFFGELFRNSIPRRIVLVLGAAFFAFFFNCLRALTLTVIVINGSHTTFEFWHDWVGAIAFALSCVGLFLVSEAVNRNHHPILARGTPRPPIPRLSPAGSIALLAIGILAFGGTEAWYRLHKPAHPPIDGIQLHWPDADKTPGFRFLKMPENVLNFLQFDSGKHAEWLLPSGDFLEIYYFTWNGSYHGLDAADNHSPNICMVRHGGAVMNGPVQHLNYTLSSGARLPFEFYPMDYPQTNQQLETFRSVWLRGPANKAASINEYRAGAGLGSIGKHFQAAFTRAIQGRRDFPMAMLLVGVEGSEGKHAAWKTVQDVLHNILIEPATQNRHNVKSNL